jgi:hypothetical protein
MLKLYPQYYRAGKHQPVISSGRRLRTSAPATNRYAKNCVSVALTKVQRAAADLIEIKNTVLSRTALRKCQPAPTGCCQIAGNSVDAS